jgi:hypothetical protein
VPEKATLSFVPYSHSSNFGGTKLKSSLPVSDLAEIKYGAEGTSPVYFLIP